MMKVLLATASFSLLTAWTSAFVPTTSPHFALRPLKYKNTSEDFVVPPMPTNAQVESETMAWMKKVVIGLNLCPFAERPIKVKELSVDVVRGDDPQDISKAVAEHMLRLLEEKGTAIIIAPEYHPEDLEEYIAMVQFLEQRVMVGFDLHDDIKLVAFHPHFAFDGSGKKDIDVYTNRSPYPMFHVLRVDEVARALQTLEGDSGKVWRRNKRLLELLDQKLGRFKVVQYLLGNRNDNNDNGNETKKDIEETRTKVEEALQETKGFMEKEDKGKVGEDSVRGVWIR